MSIAGVFELFRGRPQHDVGRDGRMALSDHLRELRARLLKSVLFITLAFVVGLVFWNDLLALVMEPYNQARHQLGSGVVSTPYVGGATGPLMLPFKLAGVASLVVASPFWLYQIWAFILPGLHPHERRWTRVFAAIAGPLFIGGVALGYLILPKGLAVLVGFTPSSLENLVEFNEYFSFLTRMLLVFGVAMEIPLFVVLLNLAGVLSGKTLGRVRPWTIIGVFVFAAVATPSTDPFSMLMLAIPLLVLMLLSEVIARFVDRARGRRKALASPWDDDQASAL